MQKPHNFASLPPVTDAVDQLSCRVNSTLRNLPISTYHNLPKTEQNNDIQFMLRLCFSVQQRQQGLCLSLDGENGNTSRAYLAIDIPPKNIVAISFLDGKKLAYNLKSTSLNDVRVLHCMIGTLLEHPLFSGPCVRSVYFDYTGSLNGRQSGTKRFRYCPRRDLQHFFEKRLPMTDGCLLILTLGLVSHRKKCTLVEDVKNAKALIQKFANESGYVTAELASYYYRSNRTNMHFMAFWILPHVTKAGPPSLSPFRCGAQTRKGNPCNNKVKTFGLRCHCHRCP
jgi:hypothetical protein